MQFFTLKDLSQQILCISFMYTGTPDEQRQQLIRNKSCKL